MNTIITNIVSKIILAIAGGVAAKYGLSSELSALAVDAGALVAGIAAWYWSHNSITNALAFVPGNAASVQKGASQLRGSPLLLLAFGLCLNAEAQTTPATTNAVPNFISQTYDWVTSVNTNYDWTNVSYQADSGYKNTTSGAPAAFVSGARNFGAFSLGAEFQVLASSATVQQCEVRAAYAFYKNHDLKIEGALYGGYDCVTSSAIIEPEIRATKLLTVNTYTFVSYSLPWETSGKFNTIGQIRSGIGIAF